MRRSAQKRIYGRHASQDPRRYVLALLSALLGVGSVQGTQRLDLRPETLEDFRTYAERVEERVRREVGASGRFHRFDHIARAERDRVLEELARGAVFVTNGYVVRDHRGRALDEADGGKIHHWYAAAFVPGVRLERVLNESRAYDRHAEVYAPYVIASAVERHDQADDVYLVYYRLQTRTAWVTATLDTTHRVQYVRSAPDRAYSIARSVRVQQVNDPGPAETLNPEGVGRGYMWATNSYWRYRERHGGVQIELESVTLTSNPWIVRIPPFNLFVRNLPRDLLTRLLEAKRRAVLEGQARDASVSERSEMSGLMGDRFPRSGSTGIDRSRRPGSAACP